MINWTSFHRPTTICWAQGQIDLVYSGSAEPGKRMLMAFMRQSGGPRVFVFGGRARINHLDRLQSCPPSSARQNYLSLLNGQGWKCEHVQLQTTWVDRLGAWSIALNLPFPPPAHSLSFQLCKWCSSGVICNVGENYTTDTETHLKKWLLIKTL